MSERSGANSDVATRDAKLEVDAGRVSDEMKILNRYFSRAHVMSIHLNFMTIGATLWYGLQLASSLRFDVD
jgi:hypothetical protein